MGSGDSRERRGLSSTVGTDNGHQFALVDAKVKAFNSGNRPVPHVEIRHFKKTQYLLQLDMLF